ncbi:MAG: IS30 family transposase [Candidatus Omnitrophica bacterium CG12_big_fil_rev_8_21_14_0_65_45_16]|nr:MAG: IS30 family transposase [Candidatus Omnitrophica bacterium CG12_big_fil_rev_8_21_14_0_65_45_16]
MERKYARLTIEEREAIVVLKANGKSLREIGEMIQRDHSVISRELKRNGSKRIYWAYQANERAKKRKSEAAGRERLKNETIRGYVKEKLKLGWSPEQIAGRIDMEHPGFAISYEAIYQYIYHDAKELIGYLPRRHEKRRQRSSLRKAKASLIPNRISITERPLEVNQRTVFGHWEADSAVSRASKAALNILVERMSRYTRLTKLSEKTAALTQEALVRRLGREKKTCLLSITYDNGTENVDHELVNQQLKTKSYFCNPYHSWEKGTVENTVGLVRRFIPKKSDFSRIPITDIARVENLLNNRPRKCLQYKTPKEVYQSLSGALAG